MEEVDQVRVGVPHNLGQHTQQQRLVPQNGLESYSAELLEAVSVDVRKVFHMELLDECLVGVV